jgi:hypothetical protein
MSVFANEWVRRAIKDDPRELLHMGKTKRMAAMAFGQVMGTEGTEGVSYPTTRQRGSRPVSHPRKSPSRRSCAPGGPEQKGDANP